VRALIDRHQADLFYALQVTFEDRLGIEVYTPISYEWFDEGYWQFGHQHFGRDLANQYLGIDAKYTPADDYWQTFDPAHPERAIRCVTLAQFRALGEFSHIVASVQDNQHGFARLAAEVGAKYVYQIGNTRQEADWSLNPLALVSSEVPITGRGVRMHQPMASCFRYHDPAEANGVISSFVNLMPRLTDWPLWLGYGRYLPEWETKVYGIDGPDGNLHPVEAIADTMAVSAFGLHLKPTGDGFGHVLHNWAAVGRPLIGRASYYRGQLGERFWQDGVTCIDLDQRSPDENAALIRAVWADKERYRAMCEAIRHEFETIDWDAEAEAVARLLL
jgi:hypothetical protein